LNLQEQNASIENLRQMKRF